MVGSRRHNLPLDVTRFARMRFKFLARYSEFMSLIGQWKGYVEVKDNGDRNVNFDVNGKRQ